MRTLGPEVGDFMRMVGAPLLPWQQHVVDVAFGVRADGKWAAYEVAIWLSRQNGKGRCTEAQELFGAYMLREKKIIHSAHEFDTSGEAFDRLVDIIENCDWLSQRTAKIVRGKGSEGIELTRAMGGGEIRFKARTAHGARGFTGERIILDEAYALTVAHFKAMSPTLATIPNPQITYTSSPPDDKTGPMPEDAITPSIRRRGLSGVEPRLASFEWSPPPGFKASIGAGNVEAWYACNPSLGYLIDEEFLASQFNIFASAGKPEGFAVEHLGVWPDEGGASWAVIPQQAWSDAGWPDMPSPEQFALAVAVAPDLSRSYICKAGPVGSDEAGRVLFGVVVVDSREGVSWVTDRLYERCAAQMPLAVVFDRNSTAEQCWLECEARDANSSWDAVKLADVMVSITPRDECAAANLFLNGLAGVPSPDPDDPEAPALDPRTVRHLGQRELTAAVAGATRKPSGSTWRWDELASDVTALKGASEALFGYLKRQPAQEAPWVWDGTL